MPDKLYAGLSFEQTVHKYSQTVVSVCIMRLKNYPDAEDCFQNVFFKLFSSSPDFSDEKHLKAWLIRVTVNCARTSAKRASKNAALSLDEISEIIPANEEKSETLLAYVFALPEKYRTVLYLFYYEDMKISDISNTLGISESAVKLRLRRGREKLKAILERESYNEF